MYLKKEKALGSGIGSRILGEPEYLRHGEIKMYFDWTWVEDIYPFPKINVMCLSCISSWFSA
jgi:hypothetical protein